MPIHTTIIHTCYTRGLKPIFFHFDPENVHENMHRFAKTLGRFRLSRTATRLLFGYQNRILEQTIAGVHFRNPVGLSAGFDKDANLTNIIPEVGFGFMEIGSVTAKPCSGNPRPRLWRLPKSKGLVVNFGLKSLGAEAVAKRLENTKPAIPLGINIAKTPIAKTSEPKAGVADYLESYRLLAKYADYITINVSCPNVDGGIPFCAPENLEPLLKALAREQLTKPHFLKLSPDLDEKTVRKLVQIGMHHKITGFICSNLTKPRTNSNIVDTVVPEHGGMSGKLVDHLADRLITIVRDESKGKTVIVACGGIFSGADAYRKIRLGASLVELITGMIFEGPQLIGQINRDLARLLKQDGFQTIREAVGVDAPLQTRN